MTRVAYLVRLSRDDLNQPGHLEEKFRLRLAMCDDLADRYHLPRAAESDQFVEQVSGGSLSKRPLMRQLLERCANRTYTHLITPYQDRLLRGDKRDEADIEDALIDGEITLITTESVLTFDASYDSSHALTYEVRAAAARHYLRDVINKLKQSNKQRAATGQRSAGMAPYGYVWVKAEYQNRRLVSAGHYAIVGDLTLTDESAARAWWNDSDSESPFDSDSYLALARRQSLPGGGLLPGVVCTAGEYFHVVELFQRIRSEGYAQLLRDFNTRQIPPPSATRFESMGGTHWHLSTIRNLIQNRHYSGFPVHRITTDRQRRKIAIDRDQWVMPDTEQPYPHPIRLPEQEALLERIRDRSSSGAPRLRSESLLTGILRCSQDQPMRSNYNSYSCACASKGQPHHGAYVRHDAIERLVVSLLEQIIARIPPEKSKRKPSAPAPNMTEQQLALLHALSAKRRDLDDLRRQTALFARLGTGDAIQSAMETLAMEIAELEAQQKAARTSQEAHTAQHALDFLRTIQQAGFSNLWSVYTVTEQRELLRTVFVSLTLPQTERKAQRIPSFDVTVRAWLLPYFPHQTVRIRHRRGAQSEIVID